MQSSRAVLLIVFKKYFVGRFLLGVVPSCVSKEVYLSPIYEAKALIMSQLKA
jgi:hypothetical protein